MTDRDDWWAVTWVVIAALAVPPLVLGIHRIRSRAPAPVPIAAETGLGDYRPNFRAGTMEGAQQTTGFLVPRVVGESVFPVYAIKFSPGMPPPPGPGEEYTEYVLPVIMVAFLDGRVIWSADRILGGAPYYIADVGEGKVRELLPLLSESVDFDDPALTQPYYPPDGYSTRLSLCASRADSLQMRSRHEVTESETPDVLVDELGRGIPLLGRSQEEVLSQGPESYRRFRKTWSRWQDLFFGLIPPEGERVDEIRFEMRRYDYGNSMQPLSQGEEVRSED